MSFDLTSLIYLLDELHDSHSSNIELLTLIESIFCLMIQSIGLVDMLTILPLNLTDPLQHKPRAWLLPLLKSSLQPTSRDFHYYVSEIIPMMQQLTTTMTESTNETQKKVLSTILLQLWEMSSSVCRLSLTEQDRQDVTQLLTLMKSCFQDPMLNSIVCQCIYTLYSCEWEGLPDYSRILLEESFDFILNNEASVSMMNMVKHITLKTRDSVMCKLTLGFK